MSHTSYQNSSYQNSNNQICPKTYARVAGVCYLVIILTGVLSQLFLQNSVLRNAMGASAGTELTINHIASFGSFWRMGFFTDVVMQIFDIPVIVILYFLLKPTHKVIALLGLLFNLIQTAVLVVNKLAILIPMIMVRSASYQIAIEQKQINAQLDLLADIHNYGFALGLIFFGCACLAYGYLIFNSGYFPKLIGVLVFIAGASYLIYSFALILEPRLLIYVNQILVLCFVGELSFCLWLIIKGVDIQKWNSAVRMDNSSVMA